jgi:O-acetyl-ADP-ribose deacetylase (regulator of RNase III)
MNIVNIHEVQTVWGYKSIELVHGDITKLDCELDCLVVSAFKNGFTPTPGTVLGALYQNHNVAIYNLIERAPINLRTPFNIWISEELNIENFKRIACIEILGTHIELDTVFKSLTSLLLICETHNIKLNSIALPILGAGNQGLNPQLIIPYLLENTHNALKNIKQLNKVLFVEMTAEKVQLLNEAINKHLKRDDSPTTRLPQTDISKNIIEELLVNLSKIKMNLPSSGTIDELIQCLKSDQTRIFETSILGRRLVERIVLDILNESNRKEDLKRSIDRLHSKQIATWIISYMHIIRTFGNFAAHDSNMLNKFPRNLSENDLINYLFSLNRVTDFWLEYDSFRRNISN